MFFDNVYWEPLPKCIYARLLVYRCFFFCPQIPPPPLLFPTTNPLFILVLVLHQELKKYGVTTVVRVCEATYDANLVAKEGIQVLVSPVQGLITGVTGKSSAVNSAAVDLKSLHTLLKRQVFATYKMKPRHIMSEFYFIFFYYEIATYNKSGKQ